jgi:hypothetical protein
VLLLAVLGLVLVDGVLAAQLRVDVLLLGLGVRDVQRRERLTYGVPVGGAVAQVAQQRLEEPVVLQDQLDHVTGDRPAEIDGSAHAGPVAHTGGGMRSAPIWRPPPSFAGAPSSAH